ncbi:LOW QUALITY PROTEIN: PHD finger protein 19-like, partial [Trematomus bernacchii]|uniref:LOW QUALITY PROTEIN: PHD finger protein 19-like n=1 Tax=Trematomus bernacchii TaxID=40690 RepID=UPI001469A189
VVPEDAAGFRCQQWFHEACTQLSTGGHVVWRQVLPVLCSVWRGSECVRALPLRWVDLVQLVLYNLSLSSKKKYFELEEILVFIKQHWDHLQLGKLSNTPPAERGQHLLEALNKYKSRFLCGKEIKKRKCIFRLRTRVPPTPPSKLFPERAQSTAGGRGVARYSASAERRKRKSKWLLEDAIPNTELSCSWSSPHHMANIFDFTLDELQSLKSSSSTAVSIDQDSTSGSATSSCSQIRGGLGSRKRKLPSNSYSQWANRSEAGEEPPELLEEQEAAAHFLSDCPPLHSSISSYFGGAGRLSSGERYQVLARRVTAGGQTQYLLQWEGTTPY